MRPKLAERHRGRHNDTGERIEVAGIGVVRARRLHAAGIVSATELAAASPETVLAALGNAVGLLKEELRRAWQAMVAARDNEVARYMWALTARELQRVHSHMLLLIKSAQERVATFLLEMAQHLPAGGTVELAMSRQDIADYLGLTIETVSRTLTQLERNAAIEVSTSRRIVLRNHSALRRLNS